MSSRGKKAAAAAPVEADETYEPKDEDMTGLRWLKRHGANPVLQFRLGGLWIDVPTVKDEGV